LLGDNNKLRKQLFAVENNTKLDYKLDYKIEQKTKHLDIFSSKKFSIIDITEFDLCQKNIISFLKSQIELNNQIDNNSINFIENLLEHTINSIRQKAETNLQNLYK